MHGNGFASSNEADTPCALRARHSSLNQEAANDFALASNRKSPRLLRFVHTRKRTSATAGRHICCPIYFFGF